MNKFQGKFGMYEMEVAAEIIMDKIEKIGPRATFTYGDFYKDQKDQNDDAMVGYCELLRHGWFRHWMYNGLYIVTDKFLERVGYENANPSTVS